MMTANDEHTNGTSPNGARQAYSLEAEQAVLGSVLLEPDTMVTVAPLVSAADFYLEAHRLLYNAMSALSERGAPVDPVSVLTELEHQGTLAQAGKREYLLALPAMVPTPYHAAHYAGEVARLATLRRLVTCGQKIAAIGYDPSNSAQDAVAQAEAAVFAVARHAGTSGFVHLSDALSAFMDHMDLISEHRGAVSGVPTGFVDLDRLLGGLQRSDLITLAARPAMGKSALSLSIVHNTALKHKSTVALFSLEMSAEQLVGRLLCMEGSLDSSRLRTGYLSEDDWSRLVQAASTLSQCAVYIDDSSALSTAELRSKTRRLHQQAPLDLVIVDYLQLLSSPGRSENRVQEVSKISRDLKGLARELEVPVVALSQLSRSVETRTSHIPLLSDLRECVAGETMLTLADGQRLPVCQLDAGAVVMAECGGRVVPAAVDAVWCTGRKPIYKLTTRSGHVLRATWNHPVRTARGWVSLGDLGPEDRVATVFRYPDLAPSAIMSTDAARLLGYLVGNGTYAKHRAVGLIMSDEQANANLRRLARQLAVPGRKRERLHAIVQSEPLATRNSIFTLPREASIVLAGLTSTWRDQQKGLARHNAQQWAAHLGASELLAWSESDVLWEHVRSVVPDGEDHVFDLRVPTTGCFIANGVVCHNSGSIEQDSDVVLFLYRDKVYNPDSEDENKARLFVSKHRNGPVGEVGLYWQEEHTRFCDLAVPGPGA